MFIFLKKVYETWKKLLCHALSSSYELHWKFNLVCFSSSGSLLRIDCRTCTPQTRIKVAALVSLVHGFEPQEVSSFKSFKGKVTLNITKIIPFVVVFLVVHDWRRIGLTLAEDYVYWRQPIPQLQSGSSSDMFAYQVLQVPLPALAWWHLSSTANMITVIKDRRKHIIPSQVRIYQNII